MINIIKNKKIIIVIGIIGVVLTIIGIIVIIVNTFNKKTLPPFAGMGSYYVNGEDGEYCYYGKDFKYVCKPDYEEYDGGEQIEGYSYDPKKNKLTYYNNENIPCREEYILYMDEDNYDFIYKYIPSYKTGKSEERVGIRTYRKNIDYSNFGTEIKDISNINIFVEYKLNSKNKTSSGNFDILQIDKEKKEYTSKKSSGTFKIYKMKTDELPNYIVFSDKNFNHEIKEGYFIKEDGNLYSDKSINVPLYIKRN